MPIFVIFYCGFASESLTAKEKVFVHCQEAQLYRDFKFKKESISAESSSSVTIISHVEALAEKWQIRLSVCVIIKICKKHLVLNTTSNICISVEI